jgi:alcohol dehydrogenase
VDPVAAAGVSDNITDGWRAVVPPLAARPGGSVLIAGTAPPGSIGLYAVAVAAATGVQRLVYADVDSHRLDIAARYGAETVDLRNRDLADTAEKFDVTVDASTNPEILRALLERTARAGHCTSTSAVGHLGGDVPMPTRKMYRNSISFSTGWVHTRPLLDHPDGPLQLLASNRLDPTPITDVHVPWDEAATALTRPFVKVITARPRLTL